MGMQVKNFYWYVLNKPLATDVADKLEQAPFEPCGLSQLSSQGWVTPLQGEGFVFNAHGAQLCMLKQEKRLLPSSVVNDYLQIKVEEFEAGEGYSPSRKIRMQMKEDITLDLLPKAFTKATKTPVLIFPRQGWLMVLTSSSKAADDTTAFLRETIGNLPISLINSDASPSHVMTRWLSSPGDLPADWTLGEELELKDPEDAVVRVKNQDLLAEELTGHLDSGKVVTKQALIWREGISIILQDDLSVKRVRLLLEDDSPIDAIESDAGKFAHEFAVSCNWLVPFCQSLLKAFGGLDKSLAASQDRAFQQPETA
jgi:recombination associated protein RdgC